MPYLARYPSPLGPLTAGSDGESLTGLWFDGQKYFADTLTGLYEKKPLLVFAQTERWLACYFSGREPDFTPPLKPEGSVFRKAVWEILLSIPYGKTITYGEIASVLAERTGRRVSAQAVGGAVGHNPISLIIPCHRVMGAKGNLTGYAGGLDKKLSLLELEGVDTSSFYMPKKGSAL